MPAEKVLHFTHTDLDDPRIVNAARTGIRTGRRVFFCGSDNGTALAGAKELFERTSWLDFPPKARVASPLPGSLSRFWKWYPYPSSAEAVSSGLKKVLEEIRPDLIHAHDLFAAYYAVKTGIATVFDDHELYSLEARAALEALSPFEFSRRAKETLKKNKWAKWEHFVGEHAPILAVSKGIADHHTSYCSHVFTIPNFPCVDSVEPRETIGSNAEPGKIRSVYLGRDQLGSTDPFRNIAGLHEAFSTNNLTGALVRIGVSEPNSDRIKSVGRLQMRDAYAMMYKECHIGLLPWRKHWFHRYANPNKVYEYAHCGLWLVSIDDIPSVQDDFGENCDLFSDYEGMAEILEKYNSSPTELDTKRQRILSYARANLIWEKNEPKILEAYQLA